MESNQPSHRAFGGVPWLPLCGAAVMLAASWQLSESWFVTPRNLRVALSALRAHLGSRLAEVSRHVGAKLHALAGGQERLGKAQDDLKARMDEVAADVLAVRGGVGALDGKMNEQIASLAFANGGILKTQALLCHVVRGMAGRDPDAMGTILDARAAQDLEHHAASYLEPTDVHTFLEDILPDTELS